MGLMSETDKVKRVVDLMNKMMCAKCERDKIGCTHEQIMDCTEFFIKEVERRAKGGVYKDRDFQRRG